MGDEHIAALTPYHVGNGVTAARGRGHCERSEKFEYAGVTLVGGVKISGGIETDAVRQGQGVRSRHKQKIIRERTVLAEYRIRRDVHRRDGCADSLVVFEDSIIGRVGDVNIVVGIDADAEWIAHAGGGQRSKRPIAIAGREFRAGSGRALPEYEIGSSVAAARDRGRLERCVVFNYAIVSAVHHIEISETVECDLRRLA